MPLKYVLAEFPFPNRLFEIGIGREHDAARLALAQSLDCTLIDELQTTALDPRDAAYSERLAFATRGACL